MEKLTHSDVKYAVALACQAGGVPATLYPLSSSAEDLRRDATALAELVQIDDSDEAMLERLQCMESTALVVVQQAGGEGVAAWRLAHRRAVIATAFIQAYRQLLADERAALGIDDEAGDRA